MLKKKKKQKDTDADWRMKTRDRTKDAKSECRRLDAYAQKKRRRTTADEEAAYPIKPKKQYESWGRATWVSGIKTSG